MNRSTRAILIVLVVARQHLTNEEVYEASKAGLHARVANSANSGPCVGLRLSFEGYDERMPALVTRVLGVLAGLRDPRELC